MHLAEWSVPPSRRLLIWGVVLLAGAATAWAFTIRPLPFSDWLYYWRAAEGSVAYERGGVLLFALRVLQEFALPPYVAALVINGFSAVTILAVAYRANGRRVGLALALVYIYLLAITPYYAVVQFDLAATALLCTGLWPLASSADLRRRPQTIGASVVLLASAVSTRPQFLLVLLVFAGLLGVAGALVRGTDSAVRRRAMWAALVLTTGALLGFAIDSALRADAGRSEAVRTNSGVTLYAGLLSSGTSPPTCGHWSPEATRDARQDAQLPLHDAVAARLQEQPLSHWVAVVRCKAGMIVFPDAYALSWSLGAPSVIASTGQTAGTDHLGAATPYLYALEGWSYRVLLWLIYAFTFATAVLNARKSRWLHALLPVFWLAAFWTVHSVFEIQGRYFLPLFIVLPLLASGSGGVLASPSLRGKLATPLQGSSGSS